MRFLISIILLSILSCTTVEHKHITVVNEEYRYNYIDSALDPILKSFEYETRIRGIKVVDTNISMTFGLVRAGQKDNTVGYCVIDPKGGVIIKIYTPAWKEMDDYQREDLVFHELGHCLIGRDHCSKINHEGPISIMNWRVLDGSYYKKHREDLVDELFNISSECVGDDVHVDEVNGTVCPQTDRNPKR